MLVIFSYHWCWFLQWHEVMIQATRTLCRSRNIMFRGSKMILVTMAKVLHWFCWKQKMKLFLLCTVQNCILQSKTRILVVLVAFAITAHASFNIRRELETQCTARVAFLTVYGLTRILSYEPGELESPLTILSWICKHYFYYNSFMLPK